MTPLPSPFPRPGYPGNPGNPGPEIPGTPENPNEPFPPRPRDGSDECTFRVVHRDGQYTVYTWNRGDMSSPASVEEFTPQGVRFSCFARTGNVWTQQIAGAPGPQQIRGVLDIQRNGVHTFHNADDGSTFVRTRDGAITITTANGQSFPIPGS